MVTAHRIERSEEAARQAPEHLPGSSELAHLAIAMAVAVLVPILTFTFIPSFIGRMTVVLLVALAIFGTQAQAGVIGVDRRDLLVCVGVYGGVMAVLAGISA